MVANAKGILQRCASYVMRGRQQAIIVGLLFTVIPLFGWVSNVIVSLVTLRKGAKEGALVLLWVSLPMVVMAALDNPWLALYNILGGSLLGYCFALILRQTQNWSKVLEIALIIGLITVGIIHLFIANVPAFWMAQISHYIGLLKTQFNLAIASKQLQFFSKFASGFQVSFFILGALINLLLARGLQSMLYNPKQLKPEIKNIRLHYWSALLLVIAAFASWQGFGLAQDALPVLLLVFGLAGLSVFHVIAAAKHGFFKGFFLIFYVALIFFFPYIAAFLIGLGLADVGLDVRQRLAYKNDKV